MFGFLKNLQAAFQNGCIKIYSHQQCTRAPFYVDIHVLSNTLLSHYLLWMEDIRRTVV
jgi:hypothetical protein